MQTYKLGQIIDIFDNQRIPISSAEREKRISGKFEKDLIPYYGATQQNGRIDDYLFDEELILLGEDGVLFYDKDKPKAYLIRGKSRVNNHAHVIRGKEGIVLNNYLCYFLNKFDYHGYVTGATRLKLNQSAMKEISIPLPSLATQRAIADKLDKLQSLIDLKKQAITKTDELAKSIFLEMFGDPMKNEKGREMKKMGDVIEINPKKSEINIDDNKEISFLPMEAIGEKGEIFRNYTKSYGEVKTGFTYFREGDVLFAKITPCMENGKGAIARGLNNGIGFGSTEFHVMRPNKMLLSEFIYCIFSFEHVRKYAETNMTGSAGQKRVSSDFLKNFKIPLPPLPLQQKFAGIITQIEAQKSEHKLALAKLEELYQAEMQESFSL